MKTTAAVLCAACAFFTIAGREARADIQTEQFCIGAGLFAKAGAMFRGDHKAISDVNKALEGRKEQLDARGMLVARYYMVGGFRSVLTPAESYSWGVDNCRGKISRIMKGGAI